MKKIICVMMVVVMMAVFATSALANGRGRIVHSGRSGSNCSSSSKGMSDGKIVLWGVGLLFTGITIAASSQQQESIYYAPVQNPPQAPPMYYQQVPSFVIGTCFPYGADFPDGVNVIGRGYFPPGSYISPGHCLE